jgi:hypothetical protein
VLLLLFYSSLASYSLRASKVLRLYQAVELQLIFAYFAVSKSQATAYVSMFVELHTKV